MKRSLLVFLGGVALGVCAGFLLRVFLEDDARSREQEARLAWLAASAISARCYSLISPSEDFDCGVRGVRRLSEDVWRVRIGAPGEPDDACYKIDLHRFRAGEAGFAGLEEYYNCRSEKGA